jgi:hypothetical protein
MSEYLLTGKRPDGATATESVQANSGDEAVEVLRQRGYTEIVLHTDDVSAALNPSQTNEHISAREYVALRQCGTYATFVGFLVLKFYKIGWKMNLAMVGLIAFRRYWGLPWNFWDFLFIGLLAIPLVAAIVTPLFGASQAYRRLIESVCWGRWEEVLQQLPSLRGKLPPHEAAMREAQALAGLGRLDEGLQLWLP